MTEPCCDYRDHGGLSLCTCPCHQDDDAREAVAWLSAATDVDLLAEVERRGYEVAS